MTGRNLIRTGEKPYLGKSTISAPITKLRTIFRDPLFVGSGMTMQSTPRAEEIASQLTPALKELSTALSPNDFFRP